MRKCGFAHIGAAIRSRKRAASRSTMSTDRAPHVYAVRQDAYSPASFPVGARSGQVVHPGSAFSYAGLTVTHRSVTHKP